MSDGARILLTGLSGFIAKETALQALRAGYRVRGTVRSLPKGPALLRDLARTGADPGAIELVEADLDRDAGWADAARGCDFVLHMASPFPRRVPRDRHALVPSARNGTLRVLRAARAAGVRRVVLTSSVAAVYYGHGARRDHPFTEADWSNVDSPSTGAYAISKTLAERAAWDYAAEAHIDLVSINPSLVLGPVTGAEDGTSIGLVRAMRAGRMPLVPRIALGIVDVRDVAEAHLRALVVPQASGRRFVASAETLSLMEIGRLVASVDPASRWRLPHAELPDAAVRVLARFLPEAAQAVPELGGRKHLVAAAAEEILGVTFRPARETLAATIASLRGSPPSPGNTD